MENQTKKNVWLFLSSVVIFCGLAVLGCCIYNGLYKISQGERVVTVRGLSEKEVKADKVKIPIGFFVSDNNLDRLADKVKKTNEIIVMFLKDNGIDDSEIRMGTPNVRENTYQGATVRYESNTTITVNTDKVEQALKIIGSFSDLLSQGVIVLQNEWNLKPEFIVSDLNTIKPKLITESMQMTIDETNRRREKQLAYNEAHGITPQAIKKSFANVLSTAPTVEKDAYVAPETITLAADPVIQYMTPQALQKSIDYTRRQMMDAAKEMNFIEAAQLRDELIKLEDQLKQMQLANS